MKKFHTCLFVVCLLSTTNVFAQESPSPTSSNSKFAFETNTFSQEDFGYMVKVEYPRITDGRFSAERLKALNRMIREYVEKMFTATAEEFEEGSNEMMVELPTAGKDEFMVSYEIKRFDDRYLSIKFDVYTYSQGAAHGLGFTDGLNYDLRNNRFVALDELFIPQSGYIQQVSDFAVALLRQQLGEESADWIEDGAGPNAENFKSFGIGDQGLFFYFSSYQVACYAAGTPEVEIPFAYLAGWKG